MGNSGFLRAHLEKMEPYSMYSQFNLGFRSNAREIMCWVERGGGDGNGCVLGFRFVKFPFSLPFPLSRSSWSPLFRLSLSFSGGACWFDCRWWLCRRTKVVGWCHHVIENSPIKEAFWDPTKCSGEIWVCGSKLHLPYLLCLHIGELWSMWLLRNLLQIVCGIGERGGGGEKRNGSGGAARISSIHGGGTPAKVGDTGTPKKKNKPKISHVRK